MKICDIIEEEKKTMIVFLKSVDGSMSVIEYDVFSVDKRDNGDIVIEYVSGSHGIVTGVTYNNDKEYYIEHVEL